MDLLNRVTVSQFVWYLVPGLGSILFILLPVYAFYPNQTLVILEKTGSFGIFIFGIVFGFFIDGLRLYRLRPNYKTIKSAFHRELLEMVSSEQDPYFVQSGVVDLAVEKKYSGLSFKHSVWIMLGNFTILSVLEAIAWGCCFINYSVSKIPNVALFGECVSRETAMIISFVISIVFFAISIRLYYISIEDQNQTNQMYLEFARHNLAKLKDSLNI